VADARAELVQTWLDDLAWDLQNVSIFAGKP
jgi:hypothetical protein